MNYHAWSGVRRVPLTKDQTRPFWQGPSSHVYQWTPERVAILLLLVEGGLSYRNIGLSMGVGRMAVAKKLWRLRVSKARAHRSMPVELSTPVQVALDERLEV
jgi:hypothetical protein